MDGLKNCSKYFLLSVSFPPGVLFGIVNLINSYVNTFLFVLF